MQLGRVRRRHRLPARRLHSRRAASRPASVWRCRAIAARFVQVGNKASRDRVDRNREINRNVCSCRFGRFCRRRAATRYNHVDSALNQLSRKCRQSIVLPLRPKVIDLDILALDIAGFLQPCRNARRRIAYDFGSALPRKPITGIACCCARAASGHKISPPPTTLMNSRRLIFAPHNSGQGIVPAQTSTLEGADGEFSQCPLWVKSDRSAKVARCPLLPRKRPDCYTTASAARTRPACRCVIFLAPLQPA